VRTRTDVEVERPGGPPGGRERVAGAVIRWTSPGRVHRIIDAGAPMPTDFELRRSDTDIAGALRRWARTAGYDIVWDLEWSAPITGRAHLEASSFTQAVQEVVGGLHAQGYPVRAEAYADRVIRFSAPE
jgi:type IV pili sensor histidine kinase/response regulator